MSVATISSEIDLTVQLLQSTWSWAELPRRLAISQVEEFNGARTSMQPGEVFMAVRFTGVRRALQVAVATIVVLSLTGPAHAAAGTDHRSLWPSTPPPDRIIIDIVTVNGSGCPRGTAAVAVSEDNEAFTVTYSEYMAQVGVGSRPTDFRKNCQLNLRVHVPGGFTYAIAQADYRGFASLARGASGLQKANYYFQGQSQTVFKNHPLGPFNAVYTEDWQATDVTDLAAIVWHPCGEQRNFNINTEVRVAAGSSNPNTTTSFMTMDSTDGEIKTIYHLAWRTCPR